MSSPDSPNSPGPRLLERFSAKAGRNIGIIAVIVFIVVAIYMLRPLPTIRGPFMYFFVRHPIVFWAPLLTALSFGGLHLLISSLRNNEEDKTEEWSPGGYTYGGYSSDRRSRRRRPSPVKTFLVAGTLAVAVAIPLSGALTGRALFNHSQFDPLAPNSLAEGQVRAQPHEVAEQLMKNSLNSPTEGPTNLHIVRVDGKLTWTAVRDPSGFFRKITKKTQGVMSLKASQTDRSLRQSGKTHDAAFKYGPGMKWADNFKWRIYKDRCYTCDVAEMTAIPTAHGPIIVAPYIKFKGGLFVKRPTLGGVYIAHPNGKIEDLSPKEAASRADIKNSGRMFPEKLARRIAQSYKYKGGIINRYFIHEEQFDVADTEGNKQPYMLDLADGGPHWVTTLKPRGRNGTTGAIIATNAVDGTTKVYRPRKDQALTGNEKAIEIARSVSLPGITFADSGAEDAGGKFRVVEPRPVFPGGRLQFLLSVIPNSANQVTKQIVVDAESNKVAAVFNTDTDPEADAKLIRYLETGDKEETGTEPGSPRKRPAGNETAVQTLQRLLDSNRRQQKQAQGRISDLKAEAEDLQQLLSQARRTPAKAPARAKTPAEPKTAP